MSLSKSELDKLRCMRTTQSRKGPEGRDRRDQVLLALRESSVASSIAYLARLLEIHPNTVRFHLDHLIERGLVEQVPAAPSGAGRPASMFQAVRRMDPGGPRGYRVLAEILSEGLASGKHPQRDAMALGRAWGATQAGSAVASKAPRSSVAVSQMVTRLDELGFAPERDRQSADDHIRIGLRHCPFLELAQSRPEVICSAHLGIMQGLAEGWQAPFIVERLDPLVEPDRCVVHLRAKAAAV